MIKGFEDMKLTPELEEKLAKLTDEERELVKLSVEWELEQQHKGLRELAAACEVYNSFCEQEMQEPDFKDTQTFAVDHFIYRLEPMKRAAIVEAYQRIEKNTATVADTQIVMEFFTDAKNARRAAPRIAVEYIDAGEKAYIRSNFVEKSVTICAHNEEEAAAAYPAAEEMYHQQAL